MMNKGLIYHTQLNAKGEVIVSTSDKVAICTQLDTISKHGLVLHCDQSTLANLFPKNANFSPKQASSLDVSFGLPEVGKVDTSCDVISVRRLSRNQFELNLRFKESESHTRTLGVVEHYVERKLRNTLVKSAVVANRIAARKVGSESIQALKHVA